MSEETVTRLILIVDDQPAILEFLDLLLTTLGYQVIQAYNGEAALHAIRQTTPDLVITDVEMPVMDGWELVRYLRSSPLWSHLPVILTSAATHLPFGPDQLDAYTRFLPKPYSIRDLHPLIRHLVVMH